MSTKPADLSGMSVYRRLLRYVLEYKGYIALGLFGLVLNAITQGLFTWILGKPLMEKAIVQHDPQVIQWLPIGILLIFLLRGFATFISGYYISLAGRLVTNSLRNQVFNHLLKMPVRFFENNNAGTILSYLNYYTDQIAAASIRSVSSLVQDSLTIIVLIGSMLYYSWQLTLGLLLIVPLIALLLNYATKRLRRLSMRLQNSVGHMTQVANEMVRSYKIVRIFNGVEFEFQRFKNANEQNMRLQMKVMLTDLISSPLIQFLIAIALAAIIYIATRESTLQTLSPGSFMSFITALILLLTPIRSLTQLNSQLQTAITAGHTLFELLDSETEKDTGTKVLTHCQGKVEYRQVSFHYPETDKWVLKDINFVAQAGEKIALVGKSGSGKTTLVNLLPRFYDVQQGEILVDDIPIKELQLNNLRQQIAYVGQEVVLFNDTVRNNIAYGEMRDLPDEDIIAAAKAAHALEFIEKLPNGFDTLIGDHGVLLSGGQRQRISIARAILSKAPILILDEATSALDTESERYIQAALDHLLANRTTFMIAHRLSTIENADRIFVMQDGVIIEAGKHADLLALDGQYARLHRMQFHENA